MAGEAQQSDLILQQARQSLANQQAGGRRAGSIGRRSAAMKRVTRRRTRPPTKCRP